MMASSFGGSSFFIANFERSILLITCMLLSFGRGTLLRRDFRASWWYWTNIFIILNCLSGCSRRRCQLTKERNKAAPDLREFVGGNLAEAPKHQALLQGEDLIVFYAASGGNRTIDHFRRVEHDRVPTISEI